jgi:hypothetical protein
MGTTQRKDTNSIYDHTLESMNSNNVGFINKTHPTYDDSTMCTIQGKYTNSIYDHILENMDSTCSNIDDVYAVSSKLKPAKWHVKSKVDQICYSLEWHVKTKR